MCCLCGLDYGYLVWCGYLLICFVVDSVGAVHYAFTIC